MHSIQLYVNIKARKNLFKKEDETSLWSNSTKTNNYPFLTRPENLSEVNFLIEAFMTTEW
jgi:hypothetical protein